MDKICQQIEWYENNSTTNEDELIKENLKLIERLVRKIENSNDKIFIDKIIATYGEIIKLQKEAKNGVVVGSDGLINQEPTQLAYIQNTTETKLTSSSSSDVVPWAYGCGPEDEKLREKNPFLPQNGEFETDKQVKKAFHNYLQYHRVSENDFSNLSKTTAYDYVSRIGVICEKLLADLQAGKLDGAVCFSRESIIPNRTYLNAFNNPSALRDYLEFKRMEISSQNVEFTTQELRDNPLNNPKNLANSLVALSRFEEFVYSVNRYGMRK